MNFTRYRKIVLTENWQNNAFAKVKKKVNIPRCFPCTYSIYFQREHPQILTGEAFWTSHNELCVGYYLRQNPDVFRPVFSSKRHNMLHTVQYGTKEDGSVSNGEASIINPYLNYAREKYVTGLQGITVVDKVGVSTIATRRIHMPMDCAEIILSFIS
ncbi:MAG: hypothetical protein CL454_00020 [Acidimicrobiaceae bacterium]|nr:hypothetical protein [Acidimicrobiaceae bacterium]